MSTDSAVARPAVFPVVATSGQNQAVAEAKASGYTQGHAAGYAAGLQLASHETAAARARMDAEHQTRMIELETRSAAEREALQLAATALAQRTVPVLAEAEQALFSCALELAQAVLGQELSDGVTSARSALARVYEQGGAEVPVAIRMHPDDLALVRGDRHELPASVELTADAALNRGDAIAEYPHGFLDARIGAAVARAQAVLLGASASGRGTEAGPSAVPRTAAVAP